MTIDLSERQEIIYNEIINVLMLGDTRAIVIGVDVAEQGASFTLEQLAEMITGPRDNTHDLEQALNKLMAEGRVVDRAKTGYSLYGLSDKVRNQALEQVRVVLAKHRAGEA
jgi:DNA-binding transcriptional regulator PaaX